MRKSYIFIVISFLLAFPALTVTIPVPIKEYLDLSRQAIRAELRKPFNEQELALMAKKMAEKLIDRYASKIQDLSTIKDELQQELSQYILTAIFEPALIDETVQEAIPADLEKIIAQITSAYPGSLSGNLLRIKYKNSVLPLTLKRSGSKNLVIKLHGAPLRLPKVFGGYAGQCLNLKINMKTNTSKIQWLGTTETVCPVPLNAGEGGFLLQLAEDISKALFLTKVELLDQSRVLCKPALVLVDFKTLRMFQNKTGWYQSSKGYGPTDPIAHQENVERGQKLRAIKLSQFNEIVGSMTPNAKTKLFGEKHTNFIERPQSAESLNSFASFMAWLWHHDCSAYTDILDLLYPYEDKTNEILTDYIELKLEKDLTKQ